MLETINNADSTYEELSVKSSIISRAPLKTMLDKNKNSEYKKVRLVYQLGYEVLESIAANNYLMKIKISKYL